MTVREDAGRIIAAALAAAQPDAAVSRALEHMAFRSGKVVLVAVGKAAWQMAKAAAGRLGGRIHSGVVITKYGHSMGHIPPLAIFEAGHPVPDHNSFAAAQAAIDAVTGLGPEDNVLFLLSGGGSALFEKPLIPAEDLERLTRELLERGADIVEMNAVRKRFSAVKGGRFAQLCAPAKVYSVVLSDIVGDPLDMIASGPACPDSATAAQAQAVAAKYRLTLTDQMAQLLRIETPKSLDNVENHITGSVRQLCAAAETVCRQLGYEPVVLTSRLTCAAREAGTFLGCIARHHAEMGRDLAFIAGGETVVRVTGKGLGGRNQELALAAAPEIAGWKNAAVFSLGSDGTDGPTDAAGGYVDGDTAPDLAAQGVDIFAALEDNDSYHALERCGGLIKTGPTGTNVNDISIALIRGA